ncbi:MAG: GGDEF domain-containing phosphodiesterase [Thiogranum sp.]|nr:GGDEF domain-containing phosphodiesterase [Thiogranum sp.]
MLRLTRTGSIDYVNPGAWATMMALGIPVDAPLMLLPSDVKRRLEHMIEQDSDWGHWQYAVITRNYEANVHHLKDFGTFHVYLRDITERVLAERRLEHMAFHDPVTDLPNRRRLVADIQQAIEKAAEGSVLLVTIERTQRIIDSMGHGIADRLYQVLSRHLAQIVMAFAGTAKSASVYRYEGEVFGVLLQDPCSPGAASQLALQIVAGFNEPLYVDGYELFLGAGIGSSRYPVDGQDAISLISCADQALQQVKGAGGGFRAYESGLSALARERLMLENHLRQALERGELELVYQPQVALSSGSIIGAEALLRWNHPVMGLLPPSKFIPLAEESGLIIPIGEWILRQACFQAQAWNRGAASPIRIAVNLSARQFISKDIIRTIAETLEQSGLPPQYLEVEVTESLAMDDVPHSIDQLRELKALGVGIALDDFGTGYSSLAYLRQFPLERLKIDRSFVSNVERESGDAILVRSIIELGHSLGMQVIAEGIESQGQYAFLREAGCDEAQGFLFSRPVGPAAFQQLIRSGPALSRILPAVL